MNAYAYGLGNSISNTDPQGLFLPLVIPFVCAAGGCETLFAGVAPALWWHHLSRTIRGTPMDPGGAWRT